jgi:hypothetical protein
MQPAAGPSLFELAPDPPFACVCAELSRLAYTAFEEGDEPLLRAALQPASHPGGQGVNHPPFGSAIEWCSIPGDAPQEGALIFAGARIEHHHP